MNDVERKQIRIRVLKTLVRVTRALHGFHEEAADACDSGALTLEEQLAMSVVAKISGNELGDAISRALDAIGDRGERELGGPVQ